MHVVKLTRFVEEVCPFCFEKPDRWWCMGRIKTKEFSPVELSILRAFEWDRINFKTREKKEKIAKLMNISTERLDEIRKGTIQKIIELIRDYYINPQKY